MSVTCAATAASGLPCTRRQTASGWCWQHEPRELPQLRLAPDGAAVLTTRCGTEFFVDVADFAHVAKYRWTLDGGYPRRWVLLAGRKPRDIRIHRDLLGLTTGDGLIGDHIDGNPLNNRRSNLRIVTQAENAQNVRARAPYRGVCLGRSGRWEATATVSGHCYYLGSYATAEEAGEVVHQWRVRNMPGYVARPDARWAS